MISPSRKRGLTVEEPDYWAEIIRARICRKAVRLREVLCKRGEEEKKGWGELMHLSSGGKKKGSGHAGIDDLLRLVRRGATGKRS